MVLYQLSYSRDSQKGARDTTPKGSFSFPEAPENDRWKLEKASWGVKLKGASSGFPDLPLRVIFGRLFRSCSGTAATQSDVRGYNPYAMVQLTRIRILPCPTPVLVLAGFGLLPGFLLGHRPAGAQEVVQVEQEDSTRADAPPHSSLLFMPPAHFSARIPTLV